MSNCLHVRVKATRKDLHNMGVCSEETFDLLLSGRAFAVEKRVAAEAGRIRVLLVHPESHTHLLWVYEEFTEPVQ